MLQYYTSFFMQTIFSLEKIISQALEIFRQELLFQNIISIVSKVKLPDIEWEVWWNIREARRGVKLCTSRLTQFRLANCAGAELQIFTDQFAKNFDHTDRVQNKFYRQCLFVLFKLKLKSWHETDQSGKTFIQTRVEKKQGGSFIKESW